MKQGIREIEYKDFSRKIFDQSARHTYPMKAQFEITYRCNIHCVHCYTDPFNHPPDLKRELPFEEVVRLLDEMAENGILWLLLTGGEAFTHPRFRDIYKEAKARGFLVSVFSNGTTLTDDLADFLASDPPFLFEVSCHGANTGTFDRVAQVPGSFKRFLKGIERILKRGLPLRIKTKAMAMNRGELPEIKAFVENLGFKFNLSTTIYPRLDGDLSSTRHRLSPQEIIETEFGNLFDSADEDESCNAREPEDSKPVLLPPADDRLFRCGCGTNSISINPYGFLRACTFTTWPSYDLKIMPLKEAFEKLVQEIQQARYTGDTPCRACPVHTLCLKNPVSALHEAGSMEAAVQHFCDTAYGTAAELTGKVFAHGKEI